MTASKRAVGAFRDALLSSDPMDVDDFISIEARKARYELFWSMYENTAYRDLLHIWSKRYKADYGLYRYIRGVYNPTYRLGEFWKSHLIGGALDPTAGDGKSVPSALPIVTDNERLRPTIAQLWKWSNWQVNKDVLSLYGAILGDAIIMIVDDPERQKVYLDVVHPGLISDITLDRWGNVKGYILEEQRILPDTNKLVMYKEVATRDGQNVHYQTFADDAPFVWNGQSDEWDVAYGFVPMVAIQHNNTGFNWGWSELHTGRHKFQEVDDLGSKLNDYIRRAVDAPWLFAGIENPANKKDGSNPRTTRTSDSATNKQAGREEMPALYGPVNSSAMALVSGLNVANASAQIQTIIQELERDYPELNINLFNATGDISGRALRVHREPVEDKVKQRRANYDDGIVRAQQMAIAIGGWRGYDGFTGFSLDSYAAGDLDHSIGDRPVFEADPQDRWEIEKAFWDAAVSATSANLPLETFLRRNGWTDEQLAEIGTQRLAAIQAAQEDKVPALPGGQKQ